MNWKDEKSQRQIRVFKTHEIPAAKERNRINLDRWNNGLKEQWELDHLQQLNHEQGAD